MNGQLESNGFPVLPVYWSSYCNILLTTTSIKFIIKAIWALTLHWQSTLILFSRRTRVRNPGSPNPGHYIKIGVSVCGIVVDRLRSAIVSHSSPRRFVLAGHPSDAAPQHLPGLLGVRKITRDRGGDPVCNRRRLYSAGHRREEQCTAPDALSAGLSCDTAAVLLCVRPAR